MRGEGGVGMRGLRYCWGFWEGMKVGRVAWFDGS